MEKADLKFPIAKIKEALDTLTALTGNPETDRKLVAIGIYTKRFGASHLIFARDKVVSAYRAARDAGRDFVVLTLEAPSNAEWEAKGFKRQGDYMVLDTGEA